MQARRSTVFIPLRRVYSRRPARSCQVPAREFQRALFKRRGERIVPAILPSEQRDHGYDFDDGVFGKVFLQLGKVRVGHRWRAAAGGKRELERSPFRGRK